MPSWSDDEGRCHFEVNGVPCYQSTIGCPAHGGATSKVKQPTQGERDAYRRGAEAMREAAVSVIEAKVSNPYINRRMAEEIRDLTIPEDES